MELHFDDTNDKFHFDGKEIIIPLRSYEIKDTEKLISLKVRKWNLRRKKKANIVSKTPFKTKWRIKITL